MKTLYMLGVWLQKVSGWKPERKVNVKERKPGAKKPGRKPKIRPEDAPVLPEIQTLNTRLGTPQTIAAPSEQRTKP